MLRFSIRLPRHSHGLCSRAAEEKEKERLARALVYNTADGQAPRPPYNLMAFTAVVLGLYIAYVKLVEEPADARRDALTKKAPLPATAARHLPDGRLLMRDGSIHKPS